MVSAVDVSREKATIFEVMNRVNLICRALDEKNFNLAHRLRDELFTYAIADIVKAGDKYTRKATWEILQILEGVDDIGV